MALDAATEQRIDDLLLRMTLAEKIGQMNQEPDLERIRPEDVREGRLGSLLCANSATAGNDRQTRVLAAGINRLQRIAVEESRLGIPLIVGRDVIHGHRTVAPIPLGQAASWSPELAKASARIAAREAHADGISWTFSPMMDVARDPRWGRVAEGYGEDPYLASRMAEATVEGFQEGGVAACAKHYIGYGAAEGGRDYNTTEISTSTLRNVYARPFEASAKAGAATFMASFNEIGGIPVTANPKLLRSLLKEEWGWDGFVVSDWGAVEELVEHGIARDRVHAAELAVRAGIDMDMVSRVYRDHLAELVEAGIVEIELIDDAVRRILRAKFRAGLFENPYVDESLASQVMVLPESRAVARETAAKSLVLLKNRDILPLPKEGRRIAIVGPLAEATGTLFGTWTLDGQAEDVVSILTACRTRTKDAPHAALTDDAIAMARWTDVVVAVVGESSGRTGEDNCTTTLDLPPGQIEFLKGLRDMNKPLVVVVVAGRPLSISWLLDQADAVLYAFHPGIEGGEAIADVLFGDASPEGRLPITFPRSVGQVPIYYNHKATGRPIPHAGSRYLDSPDTPLLPFGFGLGYTQFAYDPPQVEVGEQIVARAKVANVGSVAGVETVQLYLRDLVGQVTRPVRELKGFQKIALAAGESQVVEFALSPTDLGYWDNDGRFIVEPGSYRLWISPDAASGEAVEFEIR